MGQILKPFLLLRQANSTLNCAYFLSSRILKTFTAFKAFSSFKNPFSAFSASQLGLNWELNLGL
jgi:hypothetical protein